jgi:hypothetical protein
MTTEFFGERMMNTKQRSGLFRMTMAATIVALALSSAAFGQSSEGMNSAGGFDQAMGLPQVMIVESIDLKAGILVLNGQRYRVSSESKPLMIDAPGTTLSIEQLSVGMEVMVSTDGTEPSSSHTPVVRGLWAAP